MADFLRSGGSTGNRLSIAYFGVKGFLDNFSMKSKD
tara:strand:- start:150211 stop:150318 length:108 start_codon:yes stop_codon:yes gene_type:complete